MFQLRALHAHVRVPVAPPLRTPARHRVALPAHDVWIVVHAIETILLVTRVAPVPAGGFILSPVPRRKLRLPAPIARHVRIGVHPLAILQEITRFTHVQTLEIQRLGAIPVRVRAPRPDAVALGALLRVSRHLQRILPRHLLLLVTPLTQILPFTRPDLRTHPLSRRRRLLARRARASRRRLDAPPVLPLVTARAYRSDGRVLQRAQSSDRARARLLLLLLLLLVLVDARLARLERGDRETVLVVAIVERASARPARRALDVDADARGRRRRRRVVARARLARHGRRRLAGARRVLK